MEENLRFIMYFSNERFSIVLIVFVSCVVFVVVVVVVVVAAAAAAAGGHQAFVSSPIILRFSSSSLASIHFLTFQHPCLALHPLPLPLPRRPSLSASHLYWMRLSSLSLLVTPGDPPTKPFTPRGRYPSKLLHLVLPHYPKGRNFYPPSAPPDATRDAINLTPPTAFHKTLLLPLLLKIRAFFRLSPKTQIVSPPRIHDNTVTSPK